MKIGPDSHLLLMRLGVLMFPAYAVMDWFVYPEHLATFLGIRLAVCALVGIALWAYPHTADGAKHLIVVAAFIVAGASLTAMCALSGEGFASPYTTGVLQVIFIAALFVDVGSTAYLVTLVVVLAQHFVVLSFFPWTARALAINVFGIGLFAGMTWAIHAFIRQLTTDNRALRGIIPICASCKNVRDDEGFWKDVASYVSARSDANFSHGICPSCASRLYPDFALAHREESPGQGWTPEGTADTLQP